MHPEEESLEAIQHQLRDLTDAFVSETGLTFGYDERSVLHIILSESIQAATYVVLIEDEFDIEFDDEEIDADFFISLDHIARLVQKYRSAV